MKGSYVKICNVYVFSEGMLKETDDVQQKREVDEHLEHLLILLKEIEWL